MKKFFSDFCFFLFHCLPFVFLVLAGVCNGLGYEYRSVLFLIFLLTWFLIDIRSDLKDFLKSSGNKSVDNK